MAYLAVWITLLGCVCSLTYLLLSRRIVSRFEDPPRAEFGLVPATETAAAADAAQGNGIDIIFVHGLGANPDTTWSAPKTHDATAPGPRDGVWPSVNWVTDYLPYDLPAHILPYTRLFFYNYDSYWLRDAIEARLWAMGEKLVSQISLQIRRSDEERSRRLVFVAHSHGGLVVKQALLRAKQNPSYANIADRTESVLFLGTPHRGSSVTRVGQVVAQLLRLSGSNPLILNDLNYDSLALQDLQSEFISAFGDQVRMVNFFEERKTRLKLGLFHLDQYIVREQSAKFDAPWVENIGLRVDHSGLNKFGSRSTDYRCIAEALTRLISPTVERMDKRRGVYSGNLRTVESYTGRSDLSLSLEEKLHAPHPDPDLPYAVAVSGFGGSGKTQLVLNYVEQNRARYDPIIWIDAQNQNTVLASFERAFRELQLPAVEPVKADIALQDIPLIQSVLRWLRDRSGSHQEWLTVIDGADEFSWGVRNIIPRGKKGSVIITSQHNSSANLFDRRSSNLRVDKMESGEARSLLLRCLGLVNDPISQHTLSSADRVVDVLDCLALAVDLARAYIANHDDPETALRMLPGDLDIHRDDLLKDDSFAGLKPYEKTVMTVWDASLKAIEKRNPTSTLLLTFLSFMNRGNIQDEIFRQTTLTLGEFRPIQETPELNMEVARHYELPNWLVDLLTTHNDEWDSFSYRRALQPLLDYSMVQATRTDRWNGVTMHALVQWRAQQNGKEKQWGTWAFHVIALVCVGTRQNTSFRRYLLPHLTHIISCMAVSHYDLTPVEEELAKIPWWRCFAHAYHDEGRWKEAEQIWLQLVDRVSKIKGKKHLLTLNVMGELGETFQAHGRWSEAEEILAQVLKLRREILGSEDRQTLATAIDLAAAYSLSGQLQKAEELLEHVVEKSQAVLGPEDPDTLARMMIWAEIYRKMNRWRDVEDLQVQVVQTAQRVLGPEHPDTLAYMSDLAVTYTKLQKCREARHFQKQVMETSRKVFRPEHQNTLGHMNFLSRNYLALGHVQDGKELQEQVYEGYKMLLGPQHPRTAKLMRSLALTQAQLGQLQDAEELQKQALERCKMVFGSQHPDTLQCMGDLASIYAQLGQLQEAEKLGEDVLKNYTAVLGPEHPYTLFGMTDLARTYKKLGKFQSAEELQIQALRLYEQVLGLEHPRWLNAMKDLVSTYEVLGKWEQVRELQERVVEKSEAVLGPEHTDIPLLLNDLAATYLQLRQLRDAQELQLKALGICKRVLGREHDRTVFCMMNLAVTYSKQQQWQYAQDLFEELLEICKRVPDPEHRSTMVLMDILAFTYLRTGKLLEAQELQEELLEISRRLEGPAHRLTLLGKSLAAFSEELGQRQDDVDFAVQECVQGHTCDEQKRSTNTIEEL